MGLTSVKFNSSIKYFKDLTKTNTMLSSDDPKMKCKVKLSVTLINCENITKYSFVASDMTGIERVLGTSESLSCDSNGKIEFNTTFIMEYFFEKEQPLKIIVNKSNTPYKIETSMGNIVGSRNNTQKIKLPSSQEEILISAVELKDTKEYCNIILDCEENGIKWNNSKNTIYFTISSKTDLYRSESIDSNGKFRSCSIPTDLLVPSFKITFYNSKQKEITQLNTSLEEFTDSQNGKYKLIPITLRSGKNISIRNLSNRRKIITFMDYLYVGVQLGLTIAIDFTGSNMNPRDPQSLHYISNQYNDYQKAIFQCGKIISVYDFDQLFPCYGFGACLPGGSEANMCFSLNFQEDPNIYTIEAVLNTYIQNTPLLSFSGPTFFAPILRQSINLIKAENNALKYQILMILTDGIINDMNETIDQLVEGSFLPLSVIIIGIGKANFSNMNVLDADDQPLIDKKGRKSARDLVQFVPFSKFQNDAKRLAEEVLEELPMQIVQYYCMNNIFPETLKQQNTS